MIIPIVLALLRLILEIFALVNTYISWYNGDVRSAIFYIFIWMVLQGIKVSVSLGSKS